MAVGISPKLPLNENFELNKTIDEAMHQNVKMVLLTSPGERVGIPDFGVGLRRFLFEQLTDFTLGKIEERIRSQILTYVPGVIVNRVFIDSVLSNPGLIGYAENHISIIINYTVYTTGSTANMSLDATDQKISIS